MVGKIILACVLLLILFVVWSIWSTCHKGRADGFFSNIFAHVCHWFTG